MFKLELGRAASLKLLWRACHPFGSHKTREISFRSCQVFIGNGIDFKKDNIVYNALLYTQSICNLTIILYTKIFVNLQWIIQLFSLVPIVLTTFYRKKPDFVHLYLKNKTTFDQFLLNFSFSMLVCSCFSYILVLQWPSEVFK